MRKLKLFFACLLMAVLSIGQVWGADPVASSSMSDIATANSWTTASGGGTQTCYTSFNLDANITISTSGSANCGSFWGEDWRLYQAQSGDVTVTALNGCTLKDVTFTYGNKNTGVLKDGTTNINSGAKTSLSGTSKTFTVGNTSTATNGQVKITAISVTYVAASSCDKKVTISKGSPSHGDFTLSKDGAQATCDAAVTVVVDPTPAEHYKATGVTAPNSSSISAPDEDGKYTVTYAQNTNAASEINVTFTLKDQHTVTWNNHGITSTSKVYDGEKPVFPTPNPTSCDATSTTFIGWATAAWDGKLANTDGKTVYTSASAMPDVTGAITYYAVYAKATEGAASSKEYSFSIAASDFNTTSYAANDGSHSSTATATDLSGDEITVNWTSSNVMKGSGGNSTKIQFRNTPGYIYNTTDLGSISSCTITSGSKVSSFTGSAQNPSSNSTPAKYFKVVGTSGSGNTGYATSIDVTFTKSVTGPTTYSDYMTTCAAAGTCEAPSFNPTAGTFNGAQDIELQTSTPSAHIYYTLDGTDPDDGSDEYTTAIHITQNTIIKAITYADGLNESTISTGEFKIRFATAPTFSPAEGDFTTAQNVTMTATGAEHIYYTMTSDGSTPADPTIESLEYTDAIPLSANGTYKFKAIAVKAGFAPSNVTSATYTLDLPYGSIAEFIAGAPTAAAKDLVLEAADNCVITGINGTTIYAQDASGKGIMIYGLSSLPTNAAVNHQITGTINAKYQLFKNQHEMTNVDFSGATISADPVSRPAVSEYTTLAAAYAAKPMMLVKLTGVKYEGVDSYYNATFGSSKIYNTFNVFNASTVWPESNVDCDITGIVIDYNGTYELLPVFASDVVADADAAAPVFTPAGGADAENAVQVDLNSYVAITAADAKHSVNIDQVQITSTDPVSVTAVSSRDFYRDNTVTKWYYGNSASASYGITIEGVTTQGNVVAQVGGVDAISAKENDEVHILITPNTHFELATITVNGNDPDVVSAGTEYSFEMPAAAVTIAVTWNEDAKYAVTFEAGTGASGEAPTMSGDTYYEGTHITLPDNTFTYDASHVFDGWLCSANSTKYAAGADYTMTAAATTFTAQWKEKSAYSTVYTSNVSELAGTTTYHVTITNDVPEDVDYNALKAGKGETVTFTIPTNTTALYAHIAAWNNESQTVTISGACFNEDKEQAVIYDSNVASTPTTYDINDTKAGLEVPDGYFFEIPLDKAVTEPTVISITAASNKRFVLFGVNAVYPAEITLDPTSHAFGEVKEGLTKSQEFTIAANAMCTGDLAAEIIGTDADKFEVSAIAANKVTVTFAPEVGEIGDFAAQLQVSCTNANVTANLTATGISATQPEISVDKTLVEFGSVPQGNPLASQAVAVTLSNISTGATASISGTAFSIDPENLAASGDITITPNTSLSPATYSETLTISATGATPKVVTVTMTIQDKWIVTYTSNVVLSTTSGTSASNATVVINENSYEAIKAGTGSAAGAVKIIVPAYTTKLHFHAAGWKGETVKVKADGAQEQSLTSDNALTGSGTTFALQSAPQYFSIDVTDNTQPTTIEIAASAGKRFVIYGVNVDTYKRDVKVGNYGTLCVKNGGVLSGATLFEIAGKDAEKIYFDEVEGNVMEAGKPYIFLPEETGNATTTITVTYNTTNKTTAGYGNGFYGTYVDLSSATGTELDGNYVISNNRYILVDDDRVTLPAHRAYIKLDEIGSPSAPSGARRRVAISGAPAVVTDIDALNADEAPRKVMIDGQLYIILGEKMFDATGRLVK